MRKFKKVMALSLATIMTVASLAGCGSKSGAAASSVTDGGKVLNIYVWNEEFKSRVTDHYPGYEKVDDTTGKIGDVTVKWNITPSKDMAYQKNLDATLQKQASAAADDKIDIFLVEADYALKYVDTDYTVAVKDLGIADTDLANQYQYTKDIVTDSKGVLKGVSWQGCPGVLIYSREVAKDVFGTDDPAKVQEKVKDWDTFNKTAEEVKAKGYYMVSGYDDTYRVFSNNVSGKWVQDGKVVIDPALMSWVEQTKDFTEKGYNNKSSLWGDTWNKGFYADGKVFCYFGPAWFVDFCMQVDDSKSIAANGGWAATEGPQGFFWGGTWICAANGTDNKTLVADIMKQLTTNETIMKEIVVADNDFVNNKPAMEAMAADTSYKNAVLGGQNPLAMFCAGAEKIDLSNLSAYDQGCNDTFQAAMKDYFDGNATLDDALAKFKKDIVVKFPELKAE
ncbi:MAG: ABC transporter substrate-binding protein [Lachnospiraceae bacterium]